MITVHNKSNDRVSLRCGGQLAARQRGGHASLETCLVILQLNNSNTMGTTQPLRPKKKNILNALNDRRDNDGLIMLKILLNTF